MKHGKKLKKNHLFQQNIGTIGMNGGIQNLKNLGSNLDYEESGVKP